MMEHSQVGRRTEETMLVHVVSSVFSYTHELCIKFSSREVTLRQLIAWFEMVMFEVLVYQSSLKHKNGILSEFVRIPFFGRRLVCAV